MNTNQNNEIPVTNMIIISDQYNNLESQNYLAINNNIDVQIKKVEFDQNDLKFQEKLFDYLDNKPEKIKNLNITIFTKGKRILLKKAYTLWINYFLIISVSLLFFIFV